MDFRNSSRQRKAVNIATPTRDREKWVRPHYLQNVLIARSFFNTSLKTWKKEQNKYWKSRNNEKKWIPETRVRIEKQSELSEISAVALKTVSKVFPDYIQSIKKQGKSRKIILF